MNRALRRRHFRWWFLLLLVLPALVGLGLATRPDWPSQPAPPFAAAPPTEVAR